MNPITCFWTITDRFLTHELALDLSRISQTRGRGGGEWGRGFGSCHSAFGLRGKVLDSRNRVSLHASLFFEPQQLTPARRVSPPLGGENNLAGENKKEKIRKKITAARRFSESWAGFKVRQPDWALTFLSWSRWTVLFSVSSVMDETDERRLDRPPPSASFDLRNRHLPPGGQTNH